MLKLFKIVATYLNLKKKFLSQVHLVIGKFKSNSWYFDIREVKQGNRIIKKSYLNSYFLFDSICSLGLF